jgi:hypothetical protein
MIVIMPGIHAIRAAKGQPARGQIMPPAGKSVLRCSAWLERMTRAAKQVNKITHFSCLNLIVCSGCQAT